MHFINDLVVELYPVPVNIMPLEPTRIDNHRRAQWSLRLIPGSWIRQQLLTSVKSKAIQIPRLTSWHKAGKVSLSLALECLWRLQRVLRTNDNFGPSGLRRPHPKVNSTSRRRLGPNGKLPHVNS